MALSPEQVEQMRQRFLEQVSKIPDEQADYREQLRQQITNATAEQIESLLNQQGKQGDECVFCSIAKGETETFKVYEDNFIIAFLDINPAVAGQVIIVPKEHVQFIFQINDQALWSITKAIKVLEPLVVNATKAKGMSIYISQGSGSGQYFKHLSVNLIPRTEGDKAAFYWERKEFPKEEMEKVSKTIKEGVDKIIREEKDRIEASIRQKTKSEKKENKEEKLPIFPRRAA